MCNKIEKFLELKLSTIIEIQPYPFFKYILIKTKYQGSFKINIPDEMDFVESFEKIKFMLGHENPMSSIIEKFKNKNKYGKSKKIIYEVDGKTYNKEDLINSGINIGSLENAISNQRPYIGKIWKKYIYQNGKWEYKNPSLKNKQRIFFFKCLETNEIKDTKTWSKELGVHRNTLTKNVRENYKTKGLTFQKISK